MLGTWNGHKAKFVRNFGSVRSEIEKGVKSYTEEVRARTFPALQESYEMPEEEWERFFQLAEARRVAL